MVVYNMSGKIVSLKISAKKGVSKKPVKEASLKTEYGIEEDGRRSHYGGRSDSGEHVECRKNIQPLS